MKTFFKKTSLIYLIIFLNINSINAQYQSIFGNNQTSWNIYNNLRILSGELSKSDITDSLTVYGDTLINGKTYKIIDDYTLWNSGKKKKPKIFFLREDVLLGKTWCFSSTNTDEKLIMDLNLTINDSFQVFDYNREIGRYHPVDSVYIKNGKKHIRLNYIPHHLKRNNEKFTLIEGVGSNIGIIFAVDYVVSDPYLLCSYKDNVIEYQNNSSIYKGVCRVYTGIEEKYDNSKMKIYPNPSTTEVIIEYENNNIPKNLSVEIYSIIGKLELVKNMKSLKKVTINTNNISSGIYFIYIKDKQNIIATKKWIKTK